MDAEERRLAQDAFLEAYMTSGRRLTACEAAGIQPRAFTYWKQHDDEFKKRFLEAQLVANEVLRDDLDRARLDGLREEEWERNEAGELVLVRKRIKQSEKVLLATAVARLEEYKPASKVELTGPGGAPLNALPTLEDAQELLRLVRGARQLGLLPEGIEDGEYREVEK